MSDANQTFITVPVTPELKRRVRLKAADREMSMADLARSAIEKELNASAPAQQAQEANEQPAPSVTR